MYEYMTLRVTIQTQANHGGDPNRVYSMAYPDGTVVEGLKSASSVASIFLSHKKLGWTLASLVVVEEAADKAVYKARLRRASVTGRQFANGLNGESAQAS